MNTGESTESRPLLLTIVVCQPAYQSDTALPYQLQDWGFVEVPCASSLYRVYELVSPESGLTQREYDLLQALWNSQSIASSATRPVLEGETQQHRLLHFMQRTRLYLDWLWDHGAPRYAVNIGVLYTVCKLVQESIEQLARRLYS